MLCWRSEFQERRNQSCQGRSDPHEDHDLPAGKEEASPPAVFLFLVTRSFFPNQFVFPHGPRWHKRHRPDLPSNVDGKRREKDAEG